MGLKAIKKKIIIIIIINLVGENITIVLGYRENWVSQIHVCGGLFTLLIRFFIAL